MVSTLGVLSIPAITFLDCQGACCGCIYIRTKLSLLHLDRSVTFKVNIGTMHFVKRRIFHSVSLSLLLECFTILTCGCSSVPKQIDKNERLGLQTQYTVCPPKLENKGNAFTRREMPYLDVSHKYYPRGTYT